MDDAVGQLGGNGPAISHLVSGEDGVGFGVKIFLPLRSPAPGAGDRKGRPDTVSLTLPFRSSHISNTSDIKTYLRRLNKLLLFFNCPASKVYSRFCYAFGWRQTR